MASHPGISEVYYLKTAPAREIRFLEVDTLLHFPPPDNGEVPAVDFGLDVEGLDFTLLVVDVTPEQLAMVRAGQLSLPQGWTLEPHQVFARLPT